jgi:hypothetical protein
MGQGSGCVENVGKLKMMLRRKNACCLEEIPTEGRAAPIRGNRGRGTDSSNRVPSSGESDANLFCEGTLCRVANFPARGSVSWHQSGFTSREERTPGLDLREAATLPSRTMMGSGRG